MNYEVKICQNACAMWYPDLSQKPSAVANATAEIMWAHICLLIMCFTPERTEHIEINYHLERRGGLQMASRRRFLHGS